MAPRAGFEVERNALSAHVVMYVDQLNTPSRTPLPSSLEFTAFGEGVGAFAVCWSTDTVTRSLGSVPGFGNWLVGRVRSWPESRKRLALQSQRANFVGPEPRLA
jgi:hypothetical protein